MPQPTPTFHLGLSQLKQPGFLGLAGNGSDSKCLVEIAKGFGCGSNIGTQNGALANGHMEKNTCGPLFVLILTHTHLVRENRPKSEKKRGVDGNQANLSSIQVHLPTMSCWGL